jgi:hypothetical protein
MLKSAGIGDGISFSDQHGTLGKRVRDLGDPACLG